MSLFLSIAEGLRGLRRLRTTASVTVLVLGLAVSLMGAGAVIAWNGGKIIKFLKGQFDMTVFVEMSVPPDNVMPLGDSISRIEGVEGVAYVSPEEAAKSYKADVGEDVVKLLGVNPFPPSFVVSISPEFGTAEEASLIANRISRLEGIDEVNYRKSLMVVVEKYTKALLVVGALIGIMVIVSAVLISANTIKLTIFARREIIRTMRMVGATYGFIRRPFIVEGIVEGIAAGAVGVLILEGARRAATRLLEGVLPVDRVEVPPEIYGGMILIAVLFGWMGALISLRKFLREVA